MLITNNRLGKKLFLKKFSPSFDFSLSENLSILAFVMISRNQNEIQEPDFSFEFTTFQSRASTNIFADFCLIYKKVT